MSANALTTCTSADWMTPLWVVAKARHLMGGIELDPASSPLANIGVRADHCLTPQKGRDGLAEPWHAKTVWLNPPGGAFVMNSDEHKAYGTRSKPCAWWMHLHREWRAGRVKEACFLAYSLSLLQVTQAAGAPFPLYHPCVFFKQRLRFETEAGPLLTDVPQRRPATSPTHANMLIWLPGPGRQQRRQINTLAAVFGDAGEVVG